MATVLRQGHSFAVCVRIEGFRQGTASAVPQMPQNQTGFSR
jgi:hypothetical protein